MGLGIFSKTLLLKCFSDDVITPASIVSDPNYVSRPASGIATAIKDLRAKGYLQKSGKGFILTEKGRRKALLIRAACGVV